MSAGRPTPSSYGDRRQAICRAGGRSSRRYTRRSVACSASKFVRRKSGSRGRRIKPSKVCSAPGHSAAEVLPSLCRHEGAECRSAFKACSAVYSHILGWSLAGSFALCALGRRNFSHTQDRLLRSYVTDQELMFWALIFSSSGEILGRCVPYIPKPKAGISVPPPHLFPLYYCTSPAANTPTRALVPCIFCTKT